MQKLKFSQSVYITDLNYVNGNFEYDINVDAGERKEFKSKNIVKSIEFADFSIKLKFTESYINKLKKFLVHMYENLRKYNINFSSFIKLYNEEISINDIKTDYRSYGFCRIVIQDGLNTYVDDIPIVTLDQPNLSSSIIETINYNFNIIKKCDGTKTQLIMDSTPVIFSSKSAGYFIHEILGHPLEFDFYQYYKNNFENLKISPKLTVIDSVVGVENIVGLNKYDDMGIPIKPLTVINNGRICNVFAINESDSFNNNLYGFGRRENYKADVMVRMRSTFIGAGNNDLNEEKIISKYKSAIFFDKAYIGGVNPQTGDYNLKGQGFIVKNGEKCNFINNLELRGNLKKDLNSFDYIGNDIKMFGNYCSKLGQTIRVAVGGPTVSIYSMDITGETYGRH